jgi:NAD+ synthase (glutamine-hydrolysing)
MLSGSLTGSDGAPLAEADLGLTGENLQSRVRAVILMALSNHFGWLVLSTSNKSESAVGYSTLYGDSVGGLAVIKDVPKLLVYRLCRYRNDVAIAGGSVPPIPQSVLDKPPSAELRPDQRDDQSLPPYEVLDPLLEAYVEDDRSAADLVAAGHDPAVVARVVRLVDLAEYKRRQSPPGLRVTTKAFGKDRRLPITNAYRGADVTGAVGPAGGRGDGSGGSGRGGHG